VRRPLTARAADASADLIITGATIHTVDDAQEHAEAFAVRDGRFAAVGSRALVDVLRGPRTQVVDLSGRTVLPGLIDAHLHLLGVGTALHGADLYGAGSFDEVIRRTHRPPLGAMVPCAYSFSSRTRSKRLGS